MFTILKLFCWMINPLEDSQLCNLFHNYVTCLHRRLNPKELKTLFPNFFIRAKFWLQERAENTTVTSKKEDYELLGIFIFPSRDSKVFKNKMAKRNATLSSWCVIFLVQTNYITWIASFNLNAHIFIARQYRVLSYYCALNIIFNLILVNNVQFENTQLNKM